MRHQFHNRRLAHRRFRPMDGIWHSARNRFIREMRARGWCSGSADESVVGFVKTLQSQHKVFLIAETVVGGLKRSDFAIGAFQRTG